MITINEAKEKAIRKKTPPGYPDVLIDRCMELSDSWLFSFADENKSFIFGCMLRVFKEDGRIAEFNGFSEENRKEAEEKLVRTFTVTEGCHF